MSDVEGAAPPPVPAATVVLLRDVDDDVETLMLRRDANLAFAGGAWVFPGGRIDDDDYPTGHTAADAATDPAVALEAARQAAVRETREEAGLDVDLDGLVWFAHWTPELTVPRRFATWFFVARAPAGAVVIDDGEIRAHEWSTPREVLRRHRSGDISLFPPTWMTLTTLGAHTCVDDVLARMRASEPTIYATRLRRVGELAVATWEGDAGYDDGDLDRAGPRHRLWLDPAGWRLETSG